MVPTWVVGQIGLASTIGVHHVYLPVPVPIGGEGDLGTVGGLSWIKIMPQAVGQFRLA